MDPRIRLTLKLIHEHNASVQHGLADASRLFRVSEPYLLRMFHREVGITFRTCLRETRMNRAAQLLQSDFCPVKQIALVCGYNDISNFYRDFKLVHGTTPQEVRFRNVALATDYRPKNTGRPSGCNLETKFPIELL